MGKTVKTVGQAQKAGLRARFGVLGKNCTASDSISVAVPGQIALPEAGEDQLRRFRLTDMESSVSIRSASRVETPSR